MKHILTIRELKAFLENAEEEEIDFNAHYVKWTIDWSGTKKLAIVS